MDLIQLKEHPAIAALVRPLSRKHKAFVQRTDTVVLSGTYWSGGSRSSYFLVDIASKKATPLDHVAPAQYGGPKNDPVQTLQPGQAVVEAGVFCGKPATPTVYLHEDEMI